MKKFILLLFSFFGAAYAVMAAKHHDSNGYTISNGFFDWKYLNVTVDGYGSFETMSTMAWYNYETVSYLNEREHGFLFCEPNSLLAEEGMKEEGYFEVEVYGGFSEIKSVFDEKYGVNSLIVPKGHIKRTGYEWEFLSFTNKEIETLSLEKNYNVYFFSYENHTLHVESLLGTMLATKMNIFLDGKFVSTSKSFILANSIIKPRKTTTLKGNVCALDMGRITVGENPSSSYNIYYKSDNTDETEHDYVDLGLPSRTMWATCNIGANTPEEPGFYFAWGEVSPQETNSDEPLFRDCRFIQRN